MQFQGLWCFFLMPYALNRPVILKALKNALGLPHVPV